MGLARPVTRALSGIALFALVVFVWPLILTLSHDHYQDKLIGDILAYLLVLKVSPLYVMIVLREYPWRESAHFFFWRLSECIQYTALFSLYIALCQPLHFNTIGVSSHAEIIEATWLQACWSRGLPLFLGINFTLLDRKPLNQISFTIEGWRKAPVLNSIALTLLCLALCAQAWVVTDEAWAPMANVELFALLSIVTICQETLRIILSQKVHVHHYYVGAVCASLCWGNHPFSIFLSHLFWGVYIEGVAAWGRDPVFLVSS